MAKPCAEGVLVTGKQADCVLVTGFGKLPPAAEPGLERDLDDIRLLASPLLEGVIALVAPAWRRPLVESPVNKRIFREQFIVLKIIFAKLCPFVCLPVFVYIHNSITVF